MRLKTLLSSAAIMTVLIGTVGFSSHAFAEKGVVLSPQTGWAVTNVADDGSGGGSYCAMARRFRDNLIMTVARNSNDETSFALDFPQGNFDTRQDFSIVLDPGAGEQRTYEIRPVSKRAFVIRLGHDEAFFAALEKTGLLRAEVGSDTYNFSLPDIASGQSQLSECLNGSTKNAAANNSAPVAAPAPSPDAEQYRKDLADLQQKIEALHDQNNRLAEVMEKDKPVEVSKPIPSEDKEGMERLNQHIGTLEHENDALRAQMESLQQSGKGGSDHDILQSEIDRLRSENAALNSQVTTAQTQSTSQGDLERRIQSLQEENTHLSSLLQNTTESFKQLSTESERMQNDLKSQADSGDKLNELNSKIAALESDNARLTQDVSSARSSSDVRNSVTARSLEDAKRLLDSQIATTKDKDAQLSAASQQVKLAEAENIYLKDQIATLGKQQTSANNEEIAKLQQALQKATAEQQSLTAENMKLKNDAMAANAKIDGELKQKIASLEAENNDMKASSTTELAETVSNKAEISRLNEKVKQLESDRAHLTQTLADTQGSLETKVTAELEVLKKENDSLKLSLDDAQKQNGALKGTQVQFDALRTENEKLKSDIAATQTAQGGQVAELSGKLNNLQIENAKLKSDIAATQTAQGGQVAELSAKLQALEADKKQLADALAAAKDGSSKAESEQLAKLNADNARLQKEIETKSAAASNVPDEVQQALDGLQKDNQRLSDELEKVSAEKAAVPQGATLSENELQEQVKNLKLENQVLRDNAQKSGKPEDVVALERQVGDLKAQNTALTDELQNTQKSITEANARTRAHETAQEKAAKANEDRMAEAAKPIEAPVAKAAPVKETAKEAEPVQKAQVKDQPAPVKTAAAVPVPARKAAYPRPEGAQNEAQALEAELAGELEDRKVSQQQAAEQEMPKAPVKEEVAEAAPTPGPVVTPVAAEELPAPVQASPKAEELPKAVEAPPEAKAEPVKMASAAPDSAQIGEILKEAHIDVEKPVASAQGGSGSTLYQWHSGQMSGVAEQRPMKSNAQFDAMAEQYLEKAQKDCHGDFAVMLDRTKDVGQTRIDSYEAACVGKNVNSGATLVFYSKDGKFTAMAHKAKADEMESTMEARDRLIEAISKSAG